MVSEIADRNVPASVVEGSVGGPGDGRELSAATPGDDVNAYEYRLALVMTGGVSLAIWMGGVTAEIFRAVQADGLYGTLLKALGAEATVDVVTGASAGGLNGVFLSSAITRDLPIAEFDSLRDVWMTSGSLTALLRNPRDRNPPSILRGDEYFRPEIERVLRRWLRHPPLGLTDVQPFDLVLTATTLSAELIMHADDRGTPIIEPVHQATFQFGKNHLTVSGQDDTNRLARQLALAARTSASFPGAFEASFVPVNTPDGDTDMAGIASFKRSRWAIDGGVLVNKPIRPALDIIKTRRPDRDGKRVLFYINPDPSDTGVEVIDKVTQPPTMASVISKALVSLPRVESVAADLKDLRRQNAAVRSQRGTRDDLLRRPDLTGGMTQLAERLYPLWKQLRDQAAVTARLQKYFREEGGALNLPVPSATTVAAYTWGALSAEMVACRRDRNWLPETFPSERELDADQSWRYGFEAIEYLCSVTLDLVRRASMARRKPSEPAVPDPARAPLDDLRGRVQDIRSAIALLRDTDDDYWRHQLRAGPKSSEQGRDSAQGRDGAKSFARRLYADLPWPPEGTPAEPWHRFAKYVGSDELVAPQRAPVPAEGADTESFAGLAGVELTEESARSAMLLARLQRKELQLARALAQTVVELGAVLTPDPAWPEVNAVHELVSALTNGTVGDADVADVLRRMFALYVVHSSLEEIDEIEGIVDFVQISADVDCPIDPGRNGATDKVAGIQLGHFGAFFKESWRANDWMWGRLDGACQLVAAFLDPPLLRRRFTDAEDALKNLGEVAVQGGDDVLKERWNQAQPAVRKELTELFDPDTDPEQFRLDATVKAMQVAFQLRIAQSELVHVADAVVRSREDGADQSSAARRFVAAAHSASAGNDALPMQDVAGLLARCDVGREALRDEVGQDLLTATASTAAAVGVTALGGASGGVSVLRPALATVRTVVMTAYLVAQNAVKRSRTAFAMTQLLLAFAVGALAVKLLGGEIGTPLLLIAIPVIAAWVLITSLTVGAWWAAIVLVPLSLLIAWTFLDECDATEAFGGDLRCPATTDPADWRKPVSMILPAIALTLVVLIAAFYLHNWLKARKMARRETPRLEQLLEKAKLSSEHYLHDGDEVAKEHYRATSAAFVRAVTAVQRPIRRARSSMLITAVVGGVAVIALWWIGDELLNGGTHQTLIDRTGDLHEWRPAVYLVGIPLLMFVLSLLRLAVTRPTRYVATKAGSRSWWSKLRDDLEDRRAAIAISAFQSSRNRGPRPDAHPSSGATHASTELTAPTPSAAERHSDYRKLSAVDDNCRRVARVLIPRNERARRARRRHEPAAVTQ